MANWIFQGNPNRFEVMALLEAQEPIDAWSITRHIGDLKPGDRAALWVSGAKAGIYVLGVVTAPPFEEVAGDGWPEDDQGSVMTFASVLLDDFLTDPITKAELAADARFAAARIITQPQAGNPFLTTDEHWAAIEDLRRTRMVGGGERRRGHACTTASPTTGRRSWRATTSDPTFSMIKAQFGDAVLSKSDTGQANEVLAKVLAHNIASLSGRSTNSGSTYRSPTAQPRLSGWRSTPSLGGSSEPEPTGQGVRAGGSDGGYPMNRSAPTPRAIVRPCQARLRCGYRSSSLIPLPL